MSDIFREVDEEVRKEQYSKLWQQYGRYAIMVAVALVLVVASHQGWQAYDLQQREAASDAYASALAAANEDAETGIGGLAAIANPQDGGYALLATFEEANRLALAGEVSAAVARWDLIAATQEAPQAMRDVAVLLSVQHQVDDGDPDSLQAKLDLLLTPDNRFRPLALELSALIALRRGDTPRAREQLQAVTDDLGAPAGARTRAAQLLSTLQD